MLEVRTRLEWAVHILADEQMVPKWPSSLWRLSPGIDHENGFLPLSVPVHALCLTYARHFPPKAYPRQTELWKSDDCTFRCLIQAMT